MDGSVRSENILALGRKLVEELGLETSVDTLGRWMAHYIAELMTKAENATGAEKSEAKKTCFEAILTLWKHRAVLPSGKRPFEDLEPIVRTIESLDPENDNPRYFPSVRVQMKEGEKECGVDSWLKSANTLDHSARILIRYCLAEAARAADDKSEDWVKLAEAAGAEDGIPEIVIRFVSSANDLSAEPDPNAETRRQLEDRLKRLDGFTRAAEAFVSDLRAKLDALPLPNEC